MMLSASRSRLSLGWVASPRMQIRQIVCSVDDQNAEIEIRRPDEERIPITERQNSNFRVVPGIWRKSIMSPSGKVLVISPMQLNPRAIKSGISSDPMPGISFANGVFPRHLTPFFLHDVVGRTISKKSSKIDRMNIRHLKSLLEENPELLRGDLKHMEDPSPLFHWAQALSNARWSKEIDHMRAQIFKAVPKFDFGTPYFDLSPEFVPSIAESLLAMNNLKINKYTDWIRIERPLIAWIYEATTFYIDRYDSNDISVLAMFFTYIGIRHSMDENAVGVAALGLKFLTDTVIDRSRHISIDAMVKVLSSLCAAQQWKNEAFEVFADEIVRNRHGSMFPPGHLVELLWVYTHRYVMSKGEAWIPKELFEFILFELSLESSINKLSPKQLKKIAELLNLLKFFDAFFWERLFYRIYSDIDNLDILNIIELFNLYLSCIPEGISAANSGVDISLQKFIIRRIRWCAKIGFLPKVPEEPLFELLRLCQIKGVIDPCLIGNVATYLVMLESRTEECTRLSKFSYEVAKVEALIRMATEFNELSTEGLLDQLNESIKEEAELFISDLPDEKTISYDATSNTRALEHYVEHYRELKKHLGSVEERFWMEHLEKRKMLAKYCCGVSLSSTARSMVYGPIIAPQHESTILSETEEAAIRNSNMAVEDDLTEVQPIGAVALDSFEEEITVEDFSEFVSMSVLEAIKKYEEHVDISDGFWNRKVLDALKEGTSLDEYFDSINIVAFPDKDDASRPLIYFSTETLVDYNPSKDSSMSDSEGEVEGFKSIGFPGLDYEGDSTEANLPENCGPENISEEEFERTGSLEDLDQTETKLYF